jgi:dynactin complex subunit
MATEVPRLGSRVYLTEGRVGKVRYVGPTQFSNEDQLGVELDPGT